MQPTPADKNTMARRNALILAVAQAFAGACPPICLSLGGLAGHYLLGADKSLATLPVTAFVLGTALGTLPAGWLARLLGRRLGLMSGALVGVAGGLLAAYAISLFAFWLFSFSMILAGAAGAFVQQYRFAATDTANAAFRPRAISWVLAGGVFAALIGPQTARLTKDLFFPTLFAGAFVGMAALSLIAAGVLSLLSFAQSPRQESASGGRPIFVIIRQRRFVIAVVCAVSSYALMSFIMTAAPLAMVACGHSVSDALFGIQWHVLAMFAPSFFTGGLIARFGQERVVAAGLVMLGLCAAVALTGLALATFWAALVFLGVGWNFGFIGATAMLSSAFSEQEAKRVQPINDFIVFSFVALASFSSGGLLNLFGWQAINLLTLPIVAGTLLVLVFSKKRARQA